MARFALEATKGASGSRRPKKRPSSIIDGFDPDVSSKKIQIYRDPIDEPMLAPAQPTPAGSTQSQVHVAPPARATIIPTPAQRRSHLPPGTAINYAPNEASRRIAERMLWVYAEVMDAEMERHVLTDSIGVNSAAAVGARLKGSPSRDALLIEKMQKRYAELTLLEEGPDAFYDAEEEKKKKIEKREERKKRKQTEKMGREMELEMEMEQDMLDVDMRGRDDANNDLYRDTANVESWLDATTGPAAPFVPDAAVSAPSMPSPQAHIYAGFRPPAALPSPIPARALGADLGPSFADRARRAWPPHLWELRNEVFHEELADGQATFPRPVQIAPPLENAPAGAEHPAASGTGYADIDPAGPYHPPGHDTMMTDPVGANTQHASVQQRGWAR